MFGNGNDNDDATSSKIIFNKDTKLYVPVVTLSAKDNQKSYFLAKDLKGHCIRMNIKQKVRIKAQSTSKDIFFESKFAVVNRLLVFVYSNQDDNAKRYKATRCHLIKGVFKNYKRII